MKSKKKFAENIFLLHEFKKTNHKNKAVRSLRELDQFIQKCLIDISILQKDFQLYIEFTKSIKEFYQRKERMDKLFKKNSGQDFNSDDEEEEEIFNPKNAEFFLRLLRDDLHQQVSFDKTWLEKYDIQACIDKFKNQCLDNRPFPECLAKFNVILDRLPDTINSNMDKLLNQLSELEEEKKFRCFENSGMDLCDCEAHSVEAIQKL